MIKQLLDKYNCDAILFTDSSNIRYFSEFKGNNGLLICTKDEMTLITDPRFELEAQETVKKAKVVINKKESSLWDIPEIYKKLNIHKLGFLTQVMTIDLYNQLKNIVGLVPIDIAPSAFRYIKTKEEISFIRKAIEIQERSYKKTLSKLSQGISEKDYAAMLDYEMKMNGAEGSSFPPMIAFAENSAIVHGSPGNKKILGNGTLIVDFGAVYNGYNSDETVTLLFGNVDKRMLNIYDDVYTAQKRAIEAVRPGVTAGELYDKAFGYLINKGHAKLIQHLLGHHIGLDTWEYPKISASSNFVFEEGMTFTIEPGLYLPNVGGVRIEDLVTVTSTGVEVLTSLPKEKTVII